MLTHANKTKPKELLSLPGTTPFSMEVIPEHTEVAVAGQRCIFLVVIAGEGEGNGASASFRWLSASSQGNLGQKST